MLADHPVTTNPTKPVTTPVLYADDYGFHTGFVWYRGHFTATGNETGINLTAGGGTHGAFSVWLNGAFLGSDTAGGDQMQMSFPFPAGALRPGQDNVVAVLTQSSGHDEDGVYGPPPSDAQKSPRGLLGASLEGASTPVTWRLQGAQGGEQLQDPVRGPMNATGLFGTNHGWDLPGYPDRDWQPVSLPDSWSGRGLPPGIGWYRTTFNLSLPRESYVPVAVQIGGPGPGPGTSGADYRAFIFVNGWLMGQYDNKLGPQHRFYVPAGILDEHGANTLAIAAWGLDPTGGGLDRVKLVAEGNQSGGVPIQTVYSPGWNPFVYGRPTAPTPTLGVTSSAALVNPGQAFTVQATLDNPGDSPLRDGAISLDVPSGWTVTPSGADSVGTVAPAATASAKFKVTAPASGTSTPGPVDLVAHATFQADGQTAVAAGDGAAAGAVRLARGELRQHRDHRQQRHKPRLRVRGIRRGGHDVLGARPGRGRLDPGRDGQRRRAHLHLAERAFRPAGQHDGRGTDHPSVGDGLEARLRGLGQQLRGVGLWNHLLHRWQHLDVLARRRQLLVCIGPERQPDQQPGGLGELRELSDRLLGPHRLRVRAVGSDRLRQDRRGGGAPGARERPGLQPGTPRVRDRRRGLGAA